MNAPGPRVPVTTQAVEDAAAVEESEQPRRRSVAEIEVAMAERGERLSRNVDELTERLRPGYLVRHGAGRAGARLTPEQAGRRVEIIGAAAGAVLVAGIIIWRARRRRR